MNSPLYNEYILIKMRSGGMNRSPKAWRTEKYKENSL
jgi:hypothetical protein